MNDPRRALAQAAADLTKELPISTAEALAETLGACDDLDWSYLRLKALQVAPEARLRSHIEAFVHHWQTEAPRITPQAVALALLASARSAASSRSEQELDLLWTGPAAQAIPVRRTDQALLEVIDGAHATLLVVSFAVYRIPEIVHALLRAVERGVRATFCLEGEEMDTCYSPINALGADLTQRTKVYFWPRDHRPADSRGRTGSMHVKCAVADEQLLYISSANLTEYAMDLNMELGVLIRGGELPAKVARQFEELIRTGTLVRLV